MKHLFISILFRLLDTSTRHYNVQYLFGVADGSFEKRKKKWERALARVWSDKDLLDFFYYQSEADKENVFRGKTRKELSVGARLRTLFIVYSARRAYENKFNEKKSPDERESVDKENRTTAKVYKDLTDVA
jgi:hypothetical protein